MFHRRPVRSAAFGLAASLVIASTAYATEVEGSASADSAVDTSLHLGGAAGVDFGYVHFEGDEVDIPEASNGAVRGRGAVSIPFLDANSVQIDVIGEQTLNASKDDDKTNGDITFAGHLSRRDPSSHLFGVFGGGGMSFDDGDDTTDLYFYFVGAESQLYWNDLTFQGQAGFLDSDDGFRETIEDAGFGRAVASYYYSPNGKISGELDYLRGNRPNGSRGNGNLEIVEWGLKAQHMVVLGGLPAPIGISLAYDGFDYKATNESDNPMVHELRLGFQMLFGSSTLIDNDRRAAGLDLPLINRWISTSVNEIE
ncbi:hypothetical protein K2X89_15385 [Myxococcota bacterium]|nr:hypothetical protein [Myxococcota bacterium]